MNLRVKTEASCCVNAAEFTRGVYRQSRLAIRRSGGDTERVFALNGEQDMVFHELQFIISYISEEMIGARVLEGVKFEFEW